MYVRFVIRTLFHIARQHALRHIMRRTANAPGTRPHKLLILALIALLFTACAIGPRQPYHSFSFNGRFDKWENHVDLLEYSYGDQYYRVRNSIYQPRSPVFKGMDRLPSGTSTNGPMPVGEFLYVKWRIRSSGKVAEHRVDLRDKLPRDMFSHRITFVIDGPQLYVYLVT